MKILANYSIVLYPILFLIGFALSVYFVSILPLGITAVLLLILSKLQNQF